MNSKIPPHGSADPSDLFVQAVRLHQGGKLREAIEAYDRTIGVAPGHFGAMGNRGVALLDLGRPLEALDSFDRSIALKGDDALAHNNRGNALRALNRPLEALASYDQAIALDAKVPLFHSNRGTALFDLGRIAEALSSFDGAIAIAPRDAIVHNNRGNALRALERFDEALASYDQALSITPNFADAHYNKANVARGMGRHDEALAGYDRAIALRPNLIEAHCNRGNLRQDMMRFQDAVADYDRAITLDPNRADIRYNRGNAFRAMGHLEAALADYDRATALQPDLLEVHANRALALLALNRPQDALASFERTRTNETLFRSTAGMRHYLKMVSCDWTDVDTYIDQLRETSSQGLVTSPPFVLLAALDDPKLHLESARLLVETNYPAKPEAAYPQRPAGDRIRIGYFSADFRWHAMMHLLLELFEKHDKERFELIAFSLAPPTDDAYRKRVIAAFDRFVDVHAMSDVQITALSRDLGIDIAVDLNGFNQNCRTAIFAGRAAPVQVNYLGYPGTMAAPYIDYLVADPVLIEPRHRQFYTEKVAYLPDTYQANCAVQPVSPVRATRDDAGLPATSFVFACFNATYKITPDMFDIWMRILRQVDDSILWLLVDQQPARDNLRTEAAKRGIDPDRLAFASTTSLDKHLDRLRLADLFLDTLPYNAHTTTSDALRMGLPVLTCPGQSFASRVAASLLSAAGLTETIAASLQEYEVMAVRLARDRESLHRLAARLRANVATSPLLDSTRHVRHLERAYSAMHDRQQSKLPPDDIWIERA